MRWQSNLFREDAKGPKYHLHHEYKGQTHVKVQAVDQDTGDYIMQHAGTVTRGNDGKAAFKPGYGAPVLSSSQIKHVEKAAQSAWDDDKHPRDEKGQFA